jgi:glycosyltransferase involved in cell wall biosynthesis
MTMNSEPSCLAIIPCHNEAAGIVDLVAAVRRHVPAILVVDDGSSDRTAELAAGAGAGVLRLGSRRGKGAALRAGFNEGLAQGFQSALTLDGDGQHLASDIPQFLRARAQGRPGLVIGDRMSSPKPMPFLRHATNVAMSAAISLAVRQSMPDTQCGFRLIRLDRKFVDLLTADHFETESDQIVAALKLDWEIAFVPTTCIYRSERSRIRPLPDAIRWLRWLRRSRCNLAQIRRKGVPSNPAPRLNTQSSTILD